MYTWRRLLLIPAFLFFTATAGVYASAPDVAVDPSPTAGVVPKDRLNLAWWRERHEAILRDAPGHADSELLWIGDSITNNFEKSKLPDENFFPTWKEFYVPRKALNLGFSGDTTGNVLWRLRHGEVDNLHPRAVVLLIGTNNTGVRKQTAPQTEVGINAVVAELERRLPASQILLLGLLPSAISPEKSATDAEVNRHLALIYGENPRVTWLDVGSVFVHDGLLNTAIFYDPRLPGHPGALHPDTIGQRRMAEAIEPTLAHLMNEAPAIPLTSMTDINTALIPVSRLEQDSYDWFARHHAELLTKQNLHPETVLIGDSITNFWGGEPYAAQANGQAAWQSVFSSTPTLNMGFGWDRIQNVFWRLQQGEFDGLAPSNIVVNIGTNNLTGTEHARANPPAEVADGLAALCHDLLDRSPKSTLILMAIFPSLAVTATNALLATRFANNSRVKFVDIGSRFVTSDGTLRRDLMPDGIHPNQAGYQMWADALGAIIHSIK
jgi:lysophospholipase L1-like esterase